MKKVLLSTLAVLGLASMAYAGTGTQADPYTVDDILGMTKTDTHEGVYLEGYIVGWYNGMNLSNATFGLPSQDENQTNIMLASSSAENDAAYCIPVQLPSGDVRKNLNLYANPDNLGHEIILYGDQIAYFGVAGFKNVKSYEWVGDAPTPGGGGNGGNEGGNTNDENTYLVNGMDDFTIQNVTLPEDLNYVWSWDTQYGAKASAFYNSTNYAAEAYLISPEITLGADTKSATFSQALNFLNGNNRADFVNVYVREGSTGDWNVATVSAWPEGTGWGFTDECSIDLSAYAGKTIQIAFRYVSTSSCAPTWEVKRLTIGGSSSTPSTPSTPTGVWSVAEALSQMAAGYEGEAQVKGYITRIDDIDTGTYGNATYYIADTEGGTPELEVYRGYGLNGAKFTSTDQLAVGALVVVEGKLVNYNGTYEFTTGSKIVSYNGETGTPEPGPGDQPGSGETPKGDCVAFVADGYSYTGAATQTVVISGTQDEGSTMMDQTWTATGVCSLDFTNNNNNVSYVTGNVVRWYKGDEITITPLNNLYVTGLRMVSGTTNPVCPSGACSLTAVNGTAWNVVSNTEATWTGSTDKAFTFSNNAQVRWQYLEVYYSEESGVNEILAADDSEAVYYNLQGVKVANPERGIFVKVVGGKAVKVVK